MDFNVCNRAQAGASQYRIYQQLLDGITDQVDVVVVCHTSPYRLVTKHHPVHHNDLLHGSSDLIFSDIEWHRQSFTGRVDPSIVCAYNFFVYHFDDHFHEFVYDICIEKIYAYLDHKKCITIRSPLVPKTIKLPTPNVIDIDKSKVVPNLVNHMTADYNQDLYHIIKRKLDEFHES